MKFITAISVISAATSAAAFAGLSTSFSSRPSSSSFVVVEKTIAPAVGVATSYRESLVKYENSREDNRKGSSSSNTDNNVWSVLATTEKWISETLQSSETASGTNPYSRKEVNYVCETQPDSPMIAANIFKRLREAREMGENHGATEEDHLAEKGEGYRPHTLRQTQVMVIPSNEQLMENFQVFDNFVNAINTARRNARDYVTEKHLDKVDEEEAGEENLDWSVSVNCAHLHPKFGSKSSQEILQEMKEEDESGEVDVNAQEYAKKRMLARQSPYPTIVVEVRAMPVDFGNNPMPQTPEPQMEEQDDDDDSADQGPSEGYSYNRKELLAKEVTNDDIRGLETLFGRPAATNHPISGDGKPAEKVEKEIAEEDFFEAIGQVSGIQEISPVSPLKMAHSWVYEKDEKFSSVTSAFTESETAEVDHAYEFVFTNIAMQQESVRNDNIHGSRRQYLVMPHFLTSSATSLEKFTKEVTNIVNTLPDLRDKVQISTFHPEHIQENRRSPLPIICLQWTEGEMQ